MKPLDFSLFSLKELLSLEACTHCGRCLPICPVAVATGREESIALGKIRLWRTAWRRQSSVLTRLVWPNWAPDYASMAEAAFSCTLCGHCQEVCPAHIDTRTLWLAQRRQMARLGLAPLPVLAMAEAVSKVGNIAGRPPAERLAWVANLPSGVPIARDPEVLLFGGCVASLYPQAFGALQSLAGILSHLNVPFSILGEEELCCGYPLLVAGLEDEAAELARQNLERIENTRACVVVTPCPSCREAFAEYYPALLGRRHAQVTFLHAVEFLATVAERLFPLPGLAQLTVTFHDPCDLGRIGGIYELPRKLLALVPGLELVEMEANRADALCCGGGGNVELAKPSLSQAIAEARLEQALATGAQAIVTTCPQCKRVLSAAARRRKVQLPTLDLCEILQNALH